MLNLNLDYDDELTEDAKALSIAMEKIQEDLPHNQNLDHNLGVTNTETALMHTHRPPIAEAVALAREVCDNEFFFGWATLYLEGDVQAAFHDIPLVWTVLKRMRDYWGPKYYRRGGGEEAWRKYNGVCCAMAVLWSVKRNTHVEKVFYFANLAKGDHSMSK